MPAGARASGTRASGEYSSVVFELALFDDEGHLRHARQRAQREGDVRAGRDRAVRGLVRGLLRIEGHAQRQRIGDGRRRGRRRRAARQVGDRQHGGAVGRGGGRQRHAAHAVEVVLDRLALALQGQGRTGLQRRRAGRGAQIRIGAPILVADLEGVVAVQRADEFPVVAQPVHGGVVLGAPAVGRAAHVQVAARQRVGAAVGGQRLRGARDQGERERGAGESELHWTRL
jgi:hypothetical protein